MTYTYDEFNFTLKFEKGELIVEGLLGFVREKNLRGGWIIGLGGLSWVELGFYDLPAQAYAWTKLDEPLELTNLIGNIARAADDEPKLHLHATVSDTAMHARGGHLKEAEAAGTVEVFIHMWDNKDGFVRRYDEQTGLDLLNL